MTKKIIFFFLFISILFAYHRLHYFFISEYDVLKISSDSSWWWIIQNWIQQDGFGFNSSSIKDRILFRLPTDIYWQEFVVNLSNFFDLNLFKTNIIISSIIFIILAISIFSLSILLLNNFIWGCLSVVCIMNTSYTLFVRYPVVPAKVWGFILFPLILISLIKIIEKNKGYLMGFFLSSISMVTYFISFCYFAIPISIATIASGVIKQKNKFNYISKQIFFWSALLILSLVVMFILKGSNNVFEAAPKNFTELFYQNHKLNLYNLVIIFITSSSSFLGLVVSYYLIRKYASNDKTYEVYFIFLATITVLLFITSIIGLILANFFDLFRTLWFWRAAYFMGLPSTLCFIIGLKVFYYSSNLNKNKKTLCTILLIIIYLVFSTIARQGYYNKPTTAIGWFLFKDHNAINLENENLKELINYSKSIQVDKFLILPPLNMQDIKTDIFEASSNIPVILSRGDHPHLIYKTDRTKDYSENIILYNKILEMNDDILKSQYFKEFLNNKNVSHILFPNEEIFDWIKINPDFEIIFENDNWLIIINK